MHIIRRQTFELILSANHGVQALQEEVRRIHHLRLVPAMEAVLRSMSVEGEAVRLDRVEIALGSISSARLEEQLLSRTCRRLREALATEIGDLRESSGAAGQILYPEESRLEMMRTFLQTGSLPWWAPEASRLDLERELAELVRTSPRPLAGMLREISAPQTVRRLVKQFSTAARRLVVAVLAPSRHVELEEAMESWATLLAPSPTIALAQPDPVFHHRHHALRFVEEETFFFLTSAGWSAGASAVLSLSDRLLEQTVRHWKREKAPTALKLARLARTVLRPDNPVRTRLEERSASLRPPRSRWGDETGPGSVAGPGDAKLHPHEPAAGGEMSDADQPSNGRPHPVQPDRRAAPESGQVPTPILGSGSSWPGLPGEESVEPSPTQDPSRPLSPREALREPDPQGASFELLESGEMHYIDNAGLVLLWPFLGFFFEKVGLVEEKKFSSEAAQERAVLLLHYLASGDSRSSEHLLLLDKLLCGWPILEPVEREFEASAAEKRESAELLDSVIANWKILKSTSAEGLRSTFLRREGRLTRQEQGWQLKVGRNGFDVLLDHLPWGIGIVLLAWMKEPLFVEW